MLTESLGWLGTICYLLAYLLLVLKKIKPEGLIFHMLNILGGVGLVLNAIKLKDYPNVAVNMAWGLIAAYAIFTLKSKQH